MAGGGGVGARQQLRGLALAVLQTAAVGICLVAADHIEAICAGDAVEADPIPGCACNFHNMHYTETERQHYQKSGLGER